MLGFRYRNWNVTNGPSLDGLLASLGSRKKRVTFTIKHDGAQKKIKGIIKSVTYAEGWGGNFWVKIREGNRGSSWYFSYNPDNRKGTILDPDSNHPFTKI